MSRLDDKRKGAIIVVMQRLHADDLSGVLMQQGGWHVLNLPAIAPHDSQILCGDYSYKRLAGEALHPARESKKMLEKTRDELGGYHFSAQYQQNPQHAEGQMVALEWFARYCPNELL